MRIQRLRMEHWRKSHEPISESPEQIKSGKLNPSVCIFWAFHVCFERSGGGGSSFLVFRFQFCLCQLIRAFLRVFAVTVAHSIGWFYRMFCCVRSCPMPNRVYTNFMFNFFFLAGTFFMCSSFLAYSICVVQNKMDSLSLFWCARVVLSRQKGKIY